MSHLDTAALEHPQLELAAAILRSGAAIRLRALGTSMLPAVWPGDLLTITPVPYGAIRAGEIVLCVRNGRFCIHRLMHVGSINGDANWITRGDSLAHHDPALPATAILGRVASIARGRRMLAPRPPTPLSRMFAWILGRSDLLCKLVLRIRSLRQRTWSQLGMSGGQRQFSPPQTAR
jgi:hypothetical protein